MIQPWKLQIELAGDNSRLFKESVIRRELQAKNHEFFRGCRAAFDNMVTFGVKKVAEITRDGPGLTANEFWTLADALAARELTGDAAQAAIAAVAAKATQESLKLK